MILSSAASQLAGGMCMEACVHGQVDWLKNQIAARRFADVVAMVSRAAAGRCTSSSVIDVCDLVQHGTHTPKQLFELKSRNDMFIATDRLVNGSHHIHDPSAIVVCYDMPAPAHYLRLVGMAGALCAEGLGAD